MVTEEHADGNSATTPEALPTEGRIADEAHRERRSADEATSGSDEGNAYVQPKKIRKPKRVKAKPNNK
jgi:hypothetical protein